LVKSLSACVLFGLTVVCGGCGGSGSGKNVSGNLRLHDGSPLVGAHVIAQSQESAAYGGGQTDANGDFVLQATNQEEGLPIGTYRVTVAEDRGEFENRRPPTISTKYRNAETSGLQFTINKGEDTVFEATLDPP
jgi:hypothetical protein